MKFCATLSFVNPDHFLSLAPIAEAYGWDTVILSDHVLHPETINAQYPYGDSNARAWDHTTPWPDVWVATAMMAAVTKTLRFFQSVYVLPMRDPFQVAKAVGTLARMSGHRVSLGVGLGWMKEEFALLGHPFEQRGPRTDEMIDVMRKLWTGEYVEHHGRFYDFDRLSMSPAAGGDVPIVIGGISEAALRRVARVGDGWAPAYLTVDEISEKLARIRTQMQELGREDHPLDVYGAPLHALDIDGYRRIRDAGVTHISTVPWLVYEGPSETIDTSQRSIEVMTDGIKRFGDEVIAKLPRD